jgi:ABC-type glycerol-3-phosphate transport system substrate-binding protein
VPIIYFNADLIAQIWGRPIPQQWDQMLALVDTLGKRVRPGVMGGYCQHPTGNWIYLSLVESLGGSMMSPDRSRIAFDEMPGTARIPIAPNGHIPPSGVASILLARDPIRQSAAWKFMKFVSGPQGQIILGKSTGYFPANELVVQRADWLGAYYQARPLAQPVIESLPFTSRWRLFPGDNSAKIDAVIFDGVASVVTLKQTPDQALATMKRDAEALLPRHS